MVWQYSTAYISPHETLRYNRNGNKRKGELFDNIQ